MTRKRFDTVRDELRELGYLEGYLERLLLRDIARPGVLGPTLRTSLRAALLGSLLLALILTAAQVYWSPLLGERVGNGLVVAAYTALIVFPFLLLLNLGAGLVALMARARPARIARPTAAVVAVAGLGFLLPWWWFRAGRSPLNLALLLLLCGAALLLGRLAGIASLALASEVKGGGTGVGRQVEKGGRRVAVALVTVSILLVGGWWLIAEREIRTAPIEARFTGVRIAVLAVDGLTFSDLDGAAADPRLAELAVSGGRFPIQAAANPVPPVEWTTVATGRDPLSHGIHSLLVERIPGLDTPFTAGYGLDALRAVARSLLPLPPPKTPIRDELRREKTFWEVAAETGMPVLAINWWATHPALLEGGTVVSDRAYAVLASGGVLDREVWPRDYGRALTNGWGHTESALSPVLGGGGAAAVDASRSDRFHSHLAVEGARSAFVTAVYLQALDVLYSQEPAAAAGRSTERARYHRFVYETAVGLGAAVAPDGVVVLIGHPGRARAGEAGVVVLIGGPIRPGSAGVEVRAVDIAPTLLALIGVPQSDEMPGRVLVEGLDSEFVRQHAPRRVSSYGRPRTRPQAGEDPSDDAARDRLRSLGYLDE